MKKNNLNINSKAILENDDLSKKPKLKSVNKKSQKNWKNSILEEEEEEDFFDYKERESILDYYDDDDEEE